MPLKETLNAQLPAFYVPDPDGDTRHAAIIDPRDYTRRQLEASDLIASVEETKNGRYEVLFYTREVPHNPDFNRLG